jgi:hypothetical protein
MCPLPLVNVGQDRRGSPYRVRVGGATGLQRCPTIKTTGALETATEMLSYGSVRLANLRGVALCCGYNCTLFAPCLFPPYEVKLLGDSIGCEWVLCPCQKARAPRFPDPVSVSPVPWIPGGRAVGGGGSQFHFQPERDI